MASSQAVFLGGGGIKAITAGSGGPMMAGFGNALEATCGSAQSGPTAKAWQASTMSRELGWIV